MKLETTINNNHSHVVEIDESGNGRTILTLPEEHSDHMHLVENNIIKEFNEHSHLLIEPEESKIKITDEYSVVLNTTLSGKVSHITPLLIGNLNSIIISSDKQINICIKIKGYNIPIFEKQGFIGNKYLSLRNDVTYSNNEKAQNFGTKWKLNDNLIIEIDGGLESMIELIFRLD